MRLRVLIVLLAMHSTACAQKDSEFFGLLRARDLTPFGYLRLDMRPAHALAEEPHSLNFEMEIAYQNTWALSPNVERYLSDLPGRRQLGPAEFEAIAALPGENYLVDLELAQVDLSFQYQVTSALSTYLIVSGASYGGGFLDSTIEQFHSAFGFSSFGRTAVTRNQVNIIFDLKSARMTVADAPSRSGFLDPTLGIRYAAHPHPEHWNFILEAATKIPLDGARFLLSTGRSDFGAQATLQRLWRRNALYLNVSAVEYAGSKEIIPTQRQLIPTLVVGYEGRVTERTNVILQGYVSPSVYKREETELHDLLATKYQLSLGVRHRSGNHLLTFAATENLQNLNNTPDIGFQLGWMYLAK